MPCFNPRFSPSLFFPAAASARLRPPPPPASPASRRLRPPPPPPPASPASRRLRRLRPPPRPPPPPPTSTASAASAHLRRLPGLPARRRFLGLGPRPWVRAGDGSSDRHLLSRALCVRAAMALVRRRLGTYICSELCGPVGSTFSYGHGRGDDAKTLAELGFQIGDYLSVAIY
ncbi:hypothetical protein GUJ93_ZPchr0002g25706 [Zizania palustris]|uniref:Uncharacterized protein n=1 Tax=Zizania palustris TaxID=103762 RepID=A0A8J5RZZ7_ZIZPA|nr:hypothetical protein GUJ93_ZPchr0002g25706 [Zizania palustris]